MTAVAVVAQVAGELPPGHLAAWADVLADATAPSAFLEARLIDARPGHALGGHARRLVAAWRAEPGLTGAALAFALRAAGQVHVTAERRRTEVAVSGPTSDAVPVRLTGAVAIEVIRAARDALLVVSFAAYGVASVVSELRAAADRGVRIDLVLETSVADGGTLHGLTGAAHAFARLRGRARFWYWPAGDRPDGGAALHAKLIAADHHRALLGSANLTDRALAGNLEIGVVLRDGTVVTRIVDHFRELMRPDLGPLRRVPTAPDVPPDRPPP